MNQQELSVYIRGDNLDNAHDVAIQQYNHVAEETGNPYLPLQLPIPNRDLLVIPFSMGSCPLTPNQVREILDQNVLPIIRQQLLTLKFSQLGRTTERVFLNDGSVLEERTPLVVIRNLINDQLYSLGCRMTCKKFQPLLNLYNHEARLPQNIRAVCEQLNIDNWTTTVNLADVELAIY